MNASAVLIYPDPADYVLEDTTALFGHVSVDRSGAQYLKCTNPLEPLSSV